MRKLISDYSGEVVAGDWSPAVEAAHDDVKTTGGEIILDVDMTVKTAPDLSGNNSVPVDFIGQPGADVTVDCNSTSIIPFNVGNGSRYRFLGIPFVAPVAANPSDCQAVIASGSNEWLVVKDCIFAGILASEALIKNNGASYLVVEDCQAGGVQMFLHSVNANRATLKNIRNLDYMAHRGRYHDRGGGHDYWVLIEEPLSGYGERRSTVSIEGFHGDERAGTQIKVDGYKRFYGNQIQTNNPGNGIWLADVDYAYIVQYHGGYNPNNSAGLKLTDCGEVIVDQFSSDDGGAAGYHKYISLETATTKLVVRNSPDVVVQAVANCSYILNGVKYKGSFVEFDS